MANTLTQSNPVYYSLASLQSGQNSTVRTVVLHKRPDHDGFGVYIGEDVPSGLYIVTVERNSPASEANLQPGDRVLAFNGQSVASIPTNPKEMLINAAMNAQSLSLTIKSTDIFQALDIPLINSSKTTNNNNNISNIRQYSTRHTIDHTTDLESYIRSLFANENIQILEAGTNNEILVKSDSYGRSSTNHHRSLPNRSEHRSSGHEKKHHPRHHHHHHRPSKRTLLETRATQTSIDEEQVPSSPPIPQYSTQPNMGTNQRILKNQTRFSADNPTQEIKETRSSQNNKVSAFTAIPPSPTFDEASPYVTTDQSPARRTSDKQTKYIPTMAHMADVVAAAVNATKKSEQPDNHTQISTREATSTTNQPSTSASSFEPVPAVAPTTTTSRNSLGTSSRDTTATAPPKRNTTPPPPTSRNPPETSARDAVVTAPKPSSSPPPYTPTADPYTPSKPTNERESANGGSYNVPKGEINQPSRTSTRADDLHEVHLVRQANFQGFGFHLQYNKTYYLVQTVEAGSPAEQANLHANDVILSINHQKTDHMPHASFVQIVNASSEVDFLVQNIEAYLRANPPPPRHQSTAPAAQPSSTNNDHDKHKNGLSKALDKLTSR